MNFLDFPVQLGPNDAVSIILDKQANVLLLDESNFQRYRSRQSFRYSGGLAQQSPVILRPTSPGSYHVVVDRGGLGGSVRASVSVIYN